MVEVVAHAEIRLWNATVGAVAELDNGRILFEYADEFRSSGLEISPIHLPLSRRGPIAFDELRRQPAFQGLPGVLADALPDAFGNQVIRAWFAARNEPRRALSPVQRLLYVGERALGALTFLPAEPLPIRPAELESLEVAALVRDARRIVHGTPDVAIPEIYRIGSSAGGMRPKALVRFDPTTRTIRSGNAPAKPGEVPCILKFDGVGDGATVDELGRPQPFNRVEAAYTAMARDAGIDTCTITMLEIDGYAHLCVHRFDVDGDERIHQHSFGGLVHVDFNDRGASSYEEYLRAVLRLRMPYAAVEQAYRRMVFNVMAVNQDDHVKNLSFQMRRDGRWQSTPAYDLTFARGADDLDGDGRPDIFVVEGGLTPAPAMLHALRGHDGATIWSVALPHAVARIAVIGDVDRDGRADVAIGMRPSGAPGLVRIVSGGTGNVVRTVSGGADTAFPRAISAAGDVDRDGHADWLVAYSASVELRSGRDDSVLTTLTPTVPAFVFAVDIDGDRDVDGDGTADVVLACDGDASGSDVGYVEIRSGATQTVLRRHVFAESVPYGGHSACVVVEDLDGDGWRDLATRVGTLLSSAGDVPISSSRTGARLFSVLGAAPRVLGDVNGDGHEDLGLGFGSLGYVHSLRPMPLAAPTHTISLSAGASVPLRLASPTTPGAAYLVLGSATGPFPGFTALGRTIPLNIDGYLTLTLSHPNAGHMANSLGFLDATGGATVNFVVPAGWPAVLRGLTLHHAFVTFAGNGLGVVGNPVPFTFVQ